MLSPEEVEQFRQKYNVTPAAEVKKPNYFSRLGSSYMKEAKSMVGSVERGAELMQEGKPIQGAVRSGLGSAGSLARATFAPITEAVAPGIQKGMDKVSNNEFVQKFAASPKVSGFLDTVFGGVKKAEEWANKHPDAAANLKDSFDIATAVVGDKASEAVIKKTVTKTKDVVSSIPKPTKVMSKTKDVLQKQTDPSKIMQRVARISKGKQAKFEKTAGESIGEYLTKRDIIGNVDDISQKLYTRFNKSKGTADAALEKLTGTYEPAPVKTALKDLLAREARVSAEGAPSPSIARVQELLTKFEKKGLTMSEINEAKRLYERNIKLDFLKQNLPEGVARANNIDNAIREWQFKQAETLGLKNLPQINKETRLAKQLLDDLGAEYAGSAGNNAITLTDWIMLSGGDPTAIAGFLAKKTFSSKSVQAAIAKALNKGKSTIKDVKADMGPSQVKQLMAPKKGAIPSQNLVPKKMGPAYSAEKQATRNSRK